MDQAEEQLLTQGLAAQRIVTQLTAIFAADNRAK